MSISEYYWFVDLSDNWLPESGHTYSGLDSFKKSIYNTFLASGYTRIRPSELNEWTLVSSFDDGLKFTKPIITDSISVGLAFKFVLFSPLGYEAEDLRTKDLSSKISPAAATTATG